MSSPIPFTQQNITLAEQMAGILTLPESAVPCPGVLLLHGFLSHKDEAGGLYRLLALSLANRGVVSLRIDFHGCGESDGNTQEMTIHHQVQDAKNAFQWLEESGYCHPRHMGIVGFGLGAGIAMILAAQNPKKIKSMVLLSPVANMRHDLQKEFGRQVFIRAAQTGLAEIETERHSQHLSAAFFDSLDDYDLSECIRSYSGALLALAGDQDYTAANATLLTASSPAKPKEALMLTGADRLFGVLGEDQSLAATVVELTSLWLVETL
ncbi:MAG: alpha/beta hydrolase [Anaerolineales bacterium]|nr:alpha/beta hydrolase [Anaerolineales bacterium]